MSAAPTSLFAEGEQPSLSLGGAAGVVASVSARTIICAMPAEAAADAGLSVGSVLHVEGEPAAIAVVRGVETPAALVDVDSLELVLIDAELKGRVAADGFLEPRITCPSVGAKVSLLNVSAALRSREASLGHPVRIGHAWDSFSIDANHLMTQGLHLSGSPLATASSLAVILRGLLRTGFPARLLLLDPDDLFTESFGAAASIVDASAGLIPPGYLTAQEMAEALEALGEPLLHDERLALASAVRGHGGSLAEIISALDGLSFGGEGAKSLIRRLTDMRKDPRAHPLFGESTDQLGSDDILQTFFRLPDGRPPMAVCQLGGVEPALRPTIARFLARMAKTLAKATAGRVPVVLAAHQSESLGLLHQENAPHFGLVTASRGLVEPERPTLLHPGTALHGAEIEVALAASQIGAGEAVLRDSSLPWLQQFEVEPLPERAVPCYPTELMQQGGDIHSLLQTVSRAFGQ